MSEQLLNSPSNENAHMPNLSQSLETDPLLPNAVSRRQHSKWAAFRRPSPLWIVPFWLLAAFTRGMTLAPRVEVYTNLACEAYRRQMHPHPHTSHFGHWQNSTYITEPGSVFLPLDLPSPDRHVSESWDSSSEDPIISRSPDKACLKDPAVQKHAAQLQTAVILVMGVLSAATTGWWGAVSDRVGRTRIMALSLLGYAFTDMMFIVVARYAKFLVPYGGHKLLILGPVVEGLLGGFSTVQASVNAYVSDATTHGSRAKTFSRIQGILFIGVAAGPAVGSALLRVKPDLLVVFLASITTSLLNCLYAFFFIPESLTDDIRSEREAKRKLARDEQAALEDAENRNWLQRLWSSISSLLFPLALFLPRRRDWRLTYIGIAIFLCMLTVGLYPMKLLYAEHLFGWSSVEMGTYLTIIGSARALHLLVLLPGIIKLLKPKIVSTVSAVDPSSVALPVTPQSHPSSAVPSRDSSQLSRAQSIVSQADSIRSQSSRAPSQISPEIIAADISFDLNLVRISLFIDALSYALIVYVGSASSAIFTSATLLAAFGGGALPGMQSAALCLLPNAQEESGKLFGAISMLQALGASILSPLLFGSMYSLTVKSFPAAIFVSGGGLIGMSFLTMLLVQPKRPKKSKKKVRRGRSTRQKSLTGSVDIRALPIIGPEP